MSAETMNSIVITGVAASASLGTDAATIWRGIRSGRCGIGPMSAIESSVPAEATGGQARDLPDDYRPDLPRAARYLRWSMEQVLHDAALSIDQEYPATRCCVVLGTTLHGIRSGGRYLRTNDPSVLGSFLAGSICRQAMDGLGICGGAMTTCSACSSSLAAISLGVTMLETRQADVVIAGGYDAISEYSWAGFNSLRLIAQDAVRPFCRDRDGMAVAEGYGLVVLERAEAARDRGARIRARVAGWGESADSHHLTQPHPKGDGALAAISTALNRADLSPQEVDMIVAHATGTLDNDSSEYCAMSRLFGEELPGIPVIGFKSFLGHTLGGAGAVELVMSCMAIEEQCIPGTLGVKADDVEYDDLGLSIGKARASRLSVTLNTSLGFGGANDCLVMTAPETTLQTKCGASCGGDSACITGISIVLPEAIGLAEFLDFMVPRNGAAWRSTSREIDERALAEHLHARRARRLSLPVKLTLAAATMAVRDAKIIENTSTLEHACAILGSAHGAVEYCHDYYEKIVEEGALAANPMLFAEGVPNAACAHVSTMLGIKGSCQTIIGSMTAGLDALALAALRVTSGAAETVLVVAAEEASPHIDRAYAANGVNGSSIVGSTASDGSVAGSVACVVESQAAAAARGIKPYASVVESTWACNPSSGRGESAASIASVLRRLSNPGPVFGANHGSWLERAEHLGIRQAGATNGGCLVERFSGNLFSVAPLVNLACTLIGHPITHRCTLVSADVTGGASAVCIEQGYRRITSSIDSH